MKKKNNYLDFVIRILKFRHGETLISYIKHEGKEIVMKDPMVMVYIPLFDKTGNISSTEVAFRDWIEGSMTTEYRIPTDYVLIQVEAESVIQNTYIKILNEEENDNQVFDDDYWKNAFDMLDSHDFKDKKNHGPKEEYFEDGEDEDDLDADGWDDMPPRFKK